MKSARTKKDSEMAAALKRCGILHGMRPHRRARVEIPSMRDVGSAAYRRRMSG